MSKRVVYPSDEQWKTIELLIPRKPVGRWGDRPRTDDRPVFEGILSILRTDDGWRDLPDRYPTNFT